MGSSLHQHTAPETESGDDGAVVGQQTGNRRFHPAGHPFLVAFVVQLLVLAGQFLASLLLVHAGHHLVWQPLRFALIQGAASATLSFLLRQPIWWWWIHAGFPLAIWLAMRTTLPAWSYLLALLLLLPWYWHTFITRVPYYPSSLPVWQAVDRLLPSGPCRVLELGSGLGGFSLWLTEAHSGCEATGVEWSPMPWLISRVRSWRKGTAACFLRQDYRQMDWQPYDLVFAYLSPAAMPEMWQLARQRMRHGTVLVSYEFGIPGVPADRTIRIAGMREELYAWYI